MTSFPSLFVSHGAPTYALHPGKAGPQLAQLARQLPRPQAIVVISPHWMTPHVRVSTAAHQQTLHDFGGFDSALYEIQYPAPGQPELAFQVISLLSRAGWVVQADPERGLDHGAWVPVRHLYPHADVPVVQVSMPLGLTPQTAVAFGAALQPLGHQGVWVIGSGSLTHNLYEVRHVSSAAEPYALEFVQWIRQCIAAGDLSELTRALELAPHAQRAHPTAEHFLPLLIAAGAAQHLLPVTVLDGGMEHGVLSMESYLFGAKISM